MLVCLLQLSWLSDGSGNSAVVYLNIPAMAMYLRISFLAGFRTYSHEAYLHKEMTWG